MVLKCPSIHGLQGFLFKKNNLFDGKIPGFLQTCFQTNPYKTAKAPWSSLIHVYPTLHLLGLVFAVVYLSLDWFKGKSTGNHGFYHQI